MKHQVKGRKLGRDTAHRKSMMRNMVTSLLGAERIETTEAKAKELRSLAERMITLGKRGTLHARRTALEVVRDKEVVKKLFDELAQRYQDRHGGYTRIIKLSPRKGDNAPMSIIELVKEPVKAKGKPKRRRRRAKAKPAAATPDAKDDKAEKVAEKAVSEELIEVKDASEMPEVLDTIPGEELEEVVEEAAPEQEPEKETEMDQEKTSEENTEIPKKDKNKPQE